MGKYLTAAFWVTFFASHNGFTPEVLVPLFIISFTESCCFIIPPDFFLPMLALNKTLIQVINITAFTIFASICGAACGYFIGKLGGQPLLHKMFKPEKIKKAEDMFLKYDAWALAIAAFTPIPYKVFTIAAGVFNMKLVKFILVSIVARSMRYMLIALLSYALLKNMTAEKVIAYLESPQFGILTFAIFAAVILIYIGYRVIAGKKKAAAAA
ncbi:MAG: VTT domain-containing protein [bacterium]